MTQRNISSPADRRGVATDTNNTDGAALLPVTPEIEALAQFLHDEGGFGDAWDNHTWPEHPDDTGQRDGGWVKIVPKDVQAQFRDVARRMHGMFAPKSHSLPGDVGMREALEGLSLAADEINGDIDLQVNGDHSEEVDVNGEYYVTLSAAKVDALNKAICVAQRLLKKVPARPANPTVEKILTLAKRKYHFQPTIGAVLRSHMPTGTTGHDWDDKEAFSQAIAILDLIPDLAALSSPLPATQEDAERSVAGVIEPQYLIRKNGAYYRPKAAGYTACIAEAGRYSLTEAIKHSHPNGPNGPRDGITYEPAPATPQRQEYEGEAVREAVEHLLEVGEFCRTDDTESALRAVRAALASQSCSILAPAEMREVCIDVAAHLAAAISLLEAAGKAAKKAAPSDKMFDQMIRDYKRSLAKARAALAHLAQATPSAVSGDAGEVETTVAAIVAHLRTRADGFRAAAKKQGKRVGPMAKGFDWAALEIESTFAALPSHKGAE